MYNILKLQRFQIPARLESARFRPNSTDQNDVTLTRLIVLTSLRIYCTLYNVQTEWMIVLTMSHYKYEIVWFILVNFMGILSKPSSAGEGFDIELWYVVLVDSRFILMNFLGILYCGMSF